MSMFVRLFFLVGLVSLASLSVVSVVLWRSSQELEQNLSTANTAAGHRALEKGSGLLESDLKATHLKIVREKAKRLEAFFADISTAVHLECALTRQFLSDSGSTEDAPPLFSDITIAKRRKAEPLFLTTFLAVKPYAMFHLSPGIDPAAVNDQTHRLQRMGTFFAETFHSVVGCWSVHYGSRDGFILGYPGRDAFDTSYDNRVRGWYTEGIAQAGFHWGVYADRDDEKLILTCAQQVTSPQFAEPLGVAAIDVVLDDVIHELFNVGSLKVTRAILVDDKHRVLVSASFEQGQVTFDKQAILKMPAVGALHVKGFVQAVEEIDSHRDEDSGMLLDGATMAESQNLFIYSTVGLKTIEETGNPMFIAKPGLAWHYILQLPTESLIKPLVAITGEMGGATRDISRAIEAQARKSTATLLSIVAATLLGALVVAYFAAKATSRPLIQMAQIARAVGGGDLRQQAVETSGGEVGELGRAINGMILGLQQRNLLKDTFGRYVAPSVVDQVLAKGNASLGGVSRVVTVFFSDIKGFTSLSEVIAPELLIQVLNEYFDAMTRVILASEGTLDKYIGDAILAFWGDPIDHGDDAVRACRTAMAQYRELKKLWVSWEARGLPCLDMRIGIQTGEVIVGNVGSELKLNYTVLGDTVNFASRLEGVNKHYGTHVLIGEQTRQSAGSAIEAREVDLLTVVGKKECVRVYELLAMAGEIPESHRAGYAHYEAGLLAYRERNWNEAEQQLRNALVVLKDDRPSSLLLERIQDYRISPPPENWDRSAVLTSK